MSINNAIANFGWKAGQNIQNTVGNALARREQRNIYAQQQQQAEQERQRQEAAQMDAQENEFGANYAKAYWSAPEQDRGRVLEAFKSDAAARGYITPNEATVINDGYMYKLAGASGLDISGQDSGDVPASIQAAMRDEKIITNPGGYPKEVVNAARIRAGLDPRAVGSSGITILNQGLTSPMAASEGIIAGSKAGATERAKLRAQGDLKPGVDAGVASAVAAAKDIASKAQSRPKAEMRVKSVVNEVKRIQDTISDAKGMVGGWTTGYGSLLSALPETEARDLGAKLTTIKANLGFQELQKMRELSPTGGALGQVAVQELVALQSVIQSLDQGQSPEQMKNNLDAIDKHLENWAGAVQESHAATYGAPSKKPDPLGLGL